MRPIALGAASALLFAVTFVLNRGMELAGGSWLWSASLRYFFMVPLLMLLVGARGRLLPLFREMRLRPGSWLLWSFVGFGLFYAPICYAAAYSPGWLTAGVWQITIISGSLLVPFFYETVMTSEGARRRRQKLPLRGLALSLIILAGVALMQIGYASPLDAGEAWLGIMAVVVASFAYPLGNRKMMELCGGRLDAYQRVLGMTIASLPCWLLLAALGWSMDGPPSGGQLLQTLLIAVFAGVAATVLFFHATDLARRSTEKMASVEATQSLEVLFAAGGEMLLLGSAYPSPISWIGMIVVMAGMVLHSYASRPRSSSLRADRAEAKEG
ncbi:multidrug resistance efflux transporter family protein [Paenibacillus sp. D51F]